MAEVGAAPFFDGRLILDRKADARLRAALPDFSRNAQSRISVLVVFSSVPTADELYALRSLGSLSSFTERVAALSLPSGSLDELAALNFVDRISKPRTLRSQLDVSVPEILAEQAWGSARDSEGHPFDGSGVVIGIVDSGIDYLHKDFVFSNGTNKILYIWDQTSDGKLPDEFDYGYECNHLDIQSQTCPEFDGGSTGQTTGHGTAVAAVAASTGEAGLLFDSCLSYHSGIFTDETAECQTYGGEPFVLLGAPNDYMYFGSNNLYNKVYFDFAVSGAYGDVTWEYSQGSSSWAKLKNDTHTIKVDDRDQTFFSLTDGTAGLSKSGTFAFSPPEKANGKTDWKTDAVDGVKDKYWLRVSVSEVIRAASVNRLRETTPYYGVAPGAYIVAVKLKDGEENHVLDGMSYVIQKARELGLPVVIDHSMGDSLGSHDGMEPLEIAMTDITRDGVPIVVSAGNSRDLDLHVNGKLPEGQSVTVSWANAPSRRKNYIDLWYSTSDSLGISVKTPSGEVVLGPTPKEGITTKDANVIIEQDEFTHGKEWWIEITSPESKLQSTPWSFTLGGVKVTNGKWDAWTEPGYFEKGDHYAIDPQDTIDSPGTAEGVITVGSYLNRLYWRSGCSECIESSLALGKFGVWTKSWSAPGTGALVDSSGMGPTRDGRTKPELTAPGAGIVTARASTRNSKLSDPDDFHQEWDGTSFAAAHVVGVIALMLQMNRYLSPSGIKSILTQSARQDGFTGKIDAHSGSPLWGWGKVNALISTLEAPTMYTVRMELQPIPGNYLADLNLDGQKLLTISLNDTKSVSLDFKQGETHTIDLTPVIIFVAPGVRYHLEESGSWTFSAGGVRHFEYKLQYYVEVVSRFGNTTGTGWYDANSTATVTVDPTVVKGFRFQGWTGSATSQSPAATIRVDSQKRLVAEWREAASPAIAGFLIAALAVVGVIGVASLTVLSKTGRFSFAWIREGERTRRLRRLLSGS